MRTFIAIDLPSTQKSILKDIQDRLRPVDADVKWVEPDNCHITLRFLGSIAEEQIKPISNIIDHMAKDTAAFGIELGVLGAFPTIERPNIIWAGLVRGNEELINLSNTLDEQLSTIGFPKEERGFHPHITIGRTRSNHNVKALCEALKTTIAIPNFQEARHITLFESVLSSDGPRYSALHRSPLNT
jgi:RNA 2',3'-cyclic 3'-phosphodiesterase